MKLDHPDAKLIKLCLKALGALAACRTAARIPDDLPDDLTSALHNCVYAAITPLAETPAVSNFGKRLKAEVAFLAMCTVKDGMQREEAVGLSALRDFMTEASA